MLAHSSDMAGHPFTSLPPDYISTVTSQGYIVSLKPISLIKSEEKKPAISYMFAEHGGERFFPCLVYEGTHPPPADLGILGDIYVDVVSVLVWGKVKAPEPDGTPKNEKWITWPGPMAHAQDIDISEEAQAQFSAHSLINHPLLPLSSRRCLWVCVQYGVAWLPPWRIHQLRTKALKDRPHWELARNGRWLVEEYIKSRNHLFPDHDPLIGGHRDVAGEGNAQPLCTATERSDSAQKKARPNEGRPDAPPNNARTFPSARTLTAAIAAAGRLQVLTGTTSIPNPPVREGRGELSYQRPRRALLPDTNMKDTHRNIARKDELRVERQSGPRTIQQDQTQPGQQVILNDNHYGELMLL
ncbi:hypothetical protein CONPUDRAFT_166221 [Coniophora puteana RWD-64-598 SS2]|uniref:Uncharacterized protein n=1 Tax=Coniophora puteana (strain RWD-64-598) TaxID=741705 RepID=A0A5M3MQ38_CONPW|nr:uncharacterized protein CONPUDRAFT_166221 [Coniophora puteana RWD-64-598 SS2]EIW80834.1 hypothetical protein CONPUDRAFT_166221 [Coniophora puteana RWD-64-598 SS2]